MFLLQRISSHFIILKIFRQNIANSIAGLKYYLYLCSSKFNFFLLMATIYLTLSTKVDATEKQEVLLRFSHGKINQRAKSNIFVFPKYWDNEKQEIKIPNFRLQDEEKIELIKFLTAQHGKLQQLTKSIVETFNETDKTTISSEWLKDYVDRYYQRGKYTPTVEYIAKKTSFFDTFEVFLTKHPLTQERRKNYRNVFRALQRFELFTQTMQEQKNFVLDIDTVSADTLQQFENYLIKEHEFYTTFPEFYKQFPKLFPITPRCTNTLVNFFKQTCTFFNWCNRNNLTQNKPFANYSMPTTVYGTPYYLTIEERNTLYNLDLSANALLESQRDIFVFQCVIGCRVGDLYGFKKNNIINGAIEYVAGKTKEERPKTLRVPLNSIATEILAKYSNLNGERLLPFISEQKYNEAIKEAFTLAGLTRNVTILNPLTRQSEIRPLNEVASSHLARRTFCGNLYKKVKDPNLVGSLSGHAEGSKAFARYRDIDEEMKIELVSLIE